MRPPSGLALGLGVLCCLIAACAAQAQAPYGPKPDEWRTKSVLHILTDRFALPDCPATPRPCKDLDNACGGNHVGLRQRLDYIQGMGFDAMWISPVTSQTGGPVRELQDGWHGYWPKNLWDLNSLLGTPEDFKSLVDAIHDRDMWVMLDIVPNHSGYFAEENIGEMTFNKPEYYHSCDGVRGGHLQQHRRVPAPAGHLPHQGTARSQPVQPSRCRDAARLDGLDPRRVQDRRLPRRCCQAHASEIHASHEGALRHPDHG